MGGSSLLGNEDEPIFQGYVLLDQSKFLVIFYKLFRLNTLIGLGMPLFYWPFGKCTPGNYCDDY